MSVEKNSELIREHLETFSELYKTSESKGRIVLYDVEPGELLLIPYKNFKQNLINEESQLLLKGEYQYAKADDKILVVVSDSKCQTIKSFLLDKNSHQNDMPKLKTIF